MTKKTIFKKVYHQFVNSECNIDYSGQVASDIIKDELLKNKPSMIARFGSTELTTIVHIKKLQTNPYNPFRNLLSKSIYNSIEIASGFFPANRETLERFTELMIQDMQVVDILGSWRLQEKYFDKELKNAVKIRLKDIEPYYHINPWTEVLDGKKILVIHPFTESIEKQYQNRKQLFNDPRILPDFELATVKAVQSYAGNRPDFTSWFDALDSMKEQIEHHNFDIAVIGCGAYGFPLAAHIKRMGKKAVHMAGATQIWFGIIGNRWENHPVISSLFNDHWIRPSISEAVKNSELGEKGIGTGSPYW